MAVPEEGKRGTADETGEQEVATRDEEEEEIAFDGKDAEKGEAETEEAFGAHTEEETEVTEEGLEEAKLG